MNHTVSFDIAKRLKEAGWPQRQSITFLYLPHAEGIEPYTVHNCKWTQEKWESNNLGEDHLAFPILTELLEALPQNIGGPDDGCLIFVQQYDDKWDVGYPSVESFVSANPCDAAGELWLWCKEKGYVK
jgi:hypothetical protein